MLYIKRWLTAPLQHADGTLEERSKGTPQGGVVSPVLANLFLHYTFDVWVTKHYPDNSWCRYADDGLVHCRTEQEAQALRAVLDVRFAQCALTMHPDKTKIIYCKDGSRKGSLSEHAVRFPRIHLSGADGEEQQEEQPVRQFHLRSVARLSRRCGRRRAMNYRNRTDLSLAGWPACTTRSAVVGWRQEIRRSAMYPSASLQHTCGMGDEKVQTAPGP